VRRTALVSLPVLALAVTGAALAPPSAGATSASSSLSFGVPRVVDPIHVYGEPDIAVNPRTGAVHASGPQGTGTQRSIYNISVDGGDSYRIVQNLPRNTERGEVSAGEPTKSALGPGGGDTEIAIARNGRAFFNDLAGLVTFTALTTTDDGKTTSVANAAAIPKPVGDRQWMALFDPRPSDHTTSAYKGNLPLNYMEYADQTNGDQVATSTDGVDYSHDAGIYANDGMHAPNHGVPVVDQHTGKFLGLTSNTTDKDGNGTDLALVGVPDVTGKLTFHYHPVATRLPGSPETLFPVLAQDGARNLYTVWVDHTNLPGVLRVGASRSRRRVADMVEAPTDQPGTGQRQRLPVGGGRQGARHHRRGLVRHEQDPEGARGQRSQRQAGPVVGPVFQPARPR